MVNYIGSEPPTDYVLWVTKNCGRTFSIENYDANDVLTDFGADVKAYIDIDKASPTIVDAVVTGSSATLSFSVEICDAVKNKMGWRVALMTDPPTPLLVGIFERHDS